MKGDKYDIFEFRVGKRPSGKEVVEIHIKLSPMKNTHGSEYKRTYFLGFLTKDNIDDINKLYGDL